MVELSRAADNSGVPGAWAQVTQAPVSGTIANGTLVDVPTASGTYWYRLQVFDTDVNFATGPAIGPVVVEPLILPASSTISPANGATDVSTTPTLSWTAVPNAQKYWITFAANQADLPIDASGEDCPACIVSIITTATSYTPSIALSSGSTYYWQVQAFNDAGDATKQGLYTPVTSFSTLTTMVTLTLYIHDGAGGTVLSGVQITGTDAAGTAFNETTDGSGLVTITGAAGTWNFTAVKSGYTDRSWTQDIVVTGAVHAFM